MMRENFISLIQEKAAQGFNRGLELFMEDLNEELVRDEVLSEHSLDAIVEHLVTDYITRKNIQLV